MGGVGASVVPDIRVYVAVAVPAELVAVTVKAWEPAAGVVPVMIPVLEASVRPVGNPVAENVNGACPVAGIANKRGVAGVDPKVNGPWSRGVAGGVVIEIMMVVWACALPATARANAERSIETRSTVLMIARFWQ
jgi:hypothetical protein